MVKAKIIFELGAQTFLKRTEIIKLPYFLG